MAINPQVTFVISLSLTFEFGVIFFSIYFWNLIISGLLLNQNMELNLYWIIYFFSAYEISKFEVGDFELYYCCRSTGPEGWRIRQRHFETITSLVQSCRRFFPSGSAFEIWSEFKWVLWRCFCIMLSYYESLSFIYFVLDIDAEPS